MKVVIIRYNAGNIRSVLFALERIGATATVTDDLSLIRSADKVIFPGVGEASSAMQYLKAKKMDELIVSLKQPVLGICLGMQLLCKHSTENDTDCMNIFENVLVTRFKPEKQRLKVPQTGWNKIQNLRSPLFEGITEGEYCYFVHGYYAGLSDYTVATTEYGKTYSSSLQRNNFYGVQFHPEKSASAGEKILKNFLSV